MTSFQERVAAKAVEVSIPRVLLSIPAWVLWLVGAAVGLVWFLLSWCFAAVVVGFSDGSRRDREAE